MTLHTHSNALQRLHSWIPDTRLATQYHPHHLRKIEAPRSSPPAENRQSRPTSCRYLSVLLRLRRVQIALARSTRAPRPWHTASLSCLPWNSPRCPRVFRFMADPYLHVSAGASVEKSFQAPSLDARQRDAREPRERAFASGCVHRVRPGAAIPACPRATGSQNAPLPAWKMLGDGADDEVDGGNAQVVLTRGQRWEGSVDRA
ncbi:hypothetical protein FIBSPDRAFT_287453 [Athelia psychrophila]|uniref:Uncharacterized protein n=1 Tax=Athelia psychrophila TaxID=1759441 RepID=A0A167XND1_9AGAM|nr:hypothetical protein FIBSPDRAFT_287453 [Fibularhizoctonia sp. CBS 109695]